jgi:carbonic anhydrase
MAVAQGVLDEHRLLEESARRVLENAPLGEGNARFVAQQTSHPNTGADRRRETAKGQHPFATIISCSDSRVPVELLFDRGIGDLFVVRVAGNVCGATQIGSVEHAVEHLGTPLIVVMGHTKCEAVAAAVDGAEAPGDISGIVDLIRPAVARAREGQSGLARDTLVAVTVRTNVWQSIENLLTKSQIVREAVKSGHAEIVGAVYDIESGRVEWLGHHTDQGKLLHLGSWGAAAAPLVPAGGTVSPTAGFVQARRDLARRSGASYLVGLARRARKRR